MKNRNKIFGGILLFTTPILGTFFSLFNLSVLDRLIPINSHTQPLFIELFSYLAIFCLGLWLLKKK